jgi:transcriptional regulator with XRE-family HTH domain
MTSDDANRAELARFLRSRRQRISPAEVGLPTGPRRRAGGLLREEIAVLAGLSPTWYTYLEQGRKIRPSSEVLDSLARVLRLTEDERRYIHLLVHGRVANAAPLDAALGPDELVSQLVDLTEGSPHPVYAVNTCCDLLAWNTAAIEWYGDWLAKDDERPNIMWWVLCTDEARERMPDWQSDARDLVARWRSEIASLPPDHRARELVGDLSRCSAEFRQWWDEYSVLEHRTALRRLRHPVHGVRLMRILPVRSPEMHSALIVFHAPIDSDDEDDVTRARHDR